MNLTRQLNVLLYEEKVGSLHLLPGDKSVFVFEPSYIDQHHRNVLSLSFKSALGDLITETRVTRGRLPPYFSNLLPEGFLREYLAELAGVKPQREFFLLGVLGRDLPGAVRVVWEGREALSFDPEQKESRPAGQKTMRFSLAGVQLKFSAIAKSSGGLTIKASGGDGSWIVKLPSLRFKHLPQNEFSMMTLAALMGLDIPKVTLVALSDIEGLPRGIETVPEQALSVQRFDREGNRRVHAEDFAQVFGVYPENKYKRASYKNLAQVLWQESGEQDVAEFVRRIVFNTLIGNADMHLKNFSLVYPDRKTARLAPGYDFVSTIAYLPDNNMALNFVKSKRMTALSLKQIEYFADQAGLPTKLVVSVAKETVQRFRTVWQKEHRHLPLARTTLKIIEKHAKSIPLYEEMG